MNDRTSRAGKQHASKPKSQVEQHVAHPRDARLKSAKPVKDTVVLVAAAQHGHKLDPPYRHNDKAYYFAVENWIRDWIQKRRGLGDTQSGMVQIASWIMDMIRPYTFKKGQPKASYKLLRKRDGVTWLVFQCKECSLATTQKHRSVEVRLTKLVNLGLVERYFERTKPEDPRLTWYGPDTQVVRVKYELYHLDRKKKRDPNLDPEDDKEND
jgi:hypothetical protein